MSGIRIVSGNARTARSLRPSERNHVRVTEDATLQPLPGTGMIILRSRRGELSLLVRIGSHLVLRYPLVPGRSP
jgi:hypothetical protein